MTDINHRRANKAPVNLRRKPREYHNGYAYPDAKQYDQMIAEQRADLDAQGKEDVRILFSDHITDKKKPYRVFCNYSRNSNASICDEAKMIKKNH